MSHSYEHREEALEHSGIRVGDLITAWHKGYWKVTKIERRFHTEEQIARFSCYQDATPGSEYSPIVTYSLVLNENLTRAKSYKSQTCDISYCKKVDKTYIDERVEELKQQMGILEDVLKEIEDAREG